MSDRLKALEDKVLANQIGLQNVYDLFKKMTDDSLIINFELARKELFREIKKIKKEVDECNDFLKKCYKKMTIINDLYSLRDMNEDLIRKFGKIIIAINKSDEDFD